MFFSSKSELFDELFTQILLKRQKKILSSECDNWEKWKLKTLQHLPQKISILLVVVELVSAGRITWYCSSERKIRILGLIERCKTEWDISIHMSNCLTFYVFEKYHLRSKVATTFSRRDATTDMSAAWRGSGHNYYHC